MGARVERAADAKDRIHATVSEKQEAFLAFVLEQYVKQGVEELDQEKLRDLLELRYHSLSDAIAELGDAGQIRDLFIGFQKYLYQEASP